MFPTLANNTHTHIPIDRQTKRCDKPMTVLKAQKISILTLCERKLRNKHKGHDRKSNKTPQQVLEFDTRSALQRFIMENSCTWKNTNFNKYAMVLRLKPVKETNNNENNKNKTITTNNYMTSTLTKGIHDTLMKLHDIFACIIHTSLCEVHSCLLGTLLLHSLTSSHTCHPLSLESLVFQNCLPVSALVL